MPLRTLLAALLAVLAAVALATASAAPPARALTVGLSDQHVETFSDPLFTGLGIRQARLVVPWDVVSTDPRLADAWLAAARAGGIEPLVAFGRSVGSHCPSAPCVLPSVSTYTAAIRAFLTRYPWVTQITPWNEGNDPGQPTWHQPAQAALYGNAVATLCPACTIVAGDVLDNGTQASWLGTYLASANPVPSVWGLHNYIDVNYGHTSGTESVLAAVPGQVWLTETAGLVRYVTSTGTTTFPYDEQRAADATAGAFAIAAAHPDRIPRVYLYQWREGPSTATWDSGLVRADGTARPALAVVRSHLPPPPVATPPTAPAAPAAPTTVSPVAPAAAAPRRPLPLAGRVVRRARGRLSVRLSCRHGGGACAGRLFLYRGRRTLQIARFTLRAGHARAVVLRAPRGSVSVVARLTRPRALMIPIVR